MRRSAIQSLGQDLQTVGVDVLVFRRKRGAARKNTYAVAGGILIAGLLGHPFPKRLDHRADWGLRYLFGIIRDNHPYLELKRGDDRPTNEAEFRLSPNAGTMGSLSGHQPMLQMTTAATLPS